MGIHTSNAPYRITIALCVILVMAFVFGGGGVRYGFANLAVQLSALACLCLNRDAFFCGVKKAPLALTALVFASLTLPLLHAIPLPPAIWTSLPGRQAVIDSFALIGAQDDWAAISVDPARSLVALSGLIVPVTILALGSALRRDHLICLGWGLAILGGITLPIGAVQILSNGATGLFYPENPMPGVLFGTFANRNSAGVFLVSALTCAALLPAPTPLRRIWMVRIGLCVLLIVGIVLTRSRSALVLAAIPAGLAIVRMFFAFRHADRTTAWRTPFLISIVGAAVIVTGVIAAIGSSPTGRINDTLSRFEATGDARSYIWEDAAYSAKRYWPIGSGMGTFDEVFQIDESLENITERRAGRAHNDYLELLIEAGLPGLIILAGWVLICGWYAIGLRKAADPWTGLAGLSILFVLAAQSITSFPLRNQTLLATASVAVLLLIRSSLDQREISQKRVSR